MKNLLLSLVLLACMCLQYSCKKSDNSASYQTPVITGIAEKDFNANPLDTVGKPNIATTVSGNTIDCYPNPCSSVFHIAFTLAQAGSTRVWMVAASYPAAPAGVSIQNQSLFNQSKPLLDTTIALIAGNQNNVSMNISSLPAGYYRVYATVNQVTLYDNIWVGQ